MNLIHTAAMRALPPFDALIAFESALRHRSMTRAAGELGLTQSAISHRLRRLEGFMGTPLLERQNGSLAATAAGAALAEGLATLLDDMAELRARSRAAVAPLTLNVGVGSALADYWLVRRLPAFAAAHPRIPIELTVVESERQARAHDLDLQILWRPAATARARSIERLLFQEHVFPVCAPALLPRRKPLRDARALACLPLLHKGPAGAESGAEWSWPAWFARLGLGAAPAGLRVDTIGTAIAAALQGAGVALARSLLVHDALAEGRLSRVLPAKWDILSSKAHLVRWPAALAGDARVRAFVDWLTHQARSIPA
jgi:LysR family transcriptional regulator, glycine cleavage system transcriptional activator